MSNIPPKLQSELTSPVTNWEVVAHVLLAVGSALRVICFFAATNNGGDALARAEITAGWLQHPSFSLEFAGPHWLPIHFWMMAALSLLLGNVMLGARLVSLVFGIFSLWAVWRIARDQYGERPALLSLAIFCFYTLHVGYSATSSSEATYLGLVLGALLCFFSYRRYKDLRLLASAGLLLTIGAGVRYEAWVFILLVGVLLVFGPSDDSFLSRNRFKSVAIFACTACLWPMFWMAAQWRLNGDPLFGIHHNADAIADQLAINSAHAGLYQLLLTPGVLLLTLTVFALVGAGYAVFLAFRKSTGRELTIIAIGFALIQFRSLLNGAILAGARYTLTDGTLIALIAGYGLYNIAMQFSICSYRTLLYTTTMVAIANLITVTALSAEPNRYIDKFRSISPLLQYPEHIEQVGKYLRPRLKPSDAVVIDNYNEESNILATAMGLPLLRGNRAFLASETEPALVLHYISTQKPQYIIMANHGDLARYVELPSGSGLLRPQNYQAACIFTDDRYKLYSISYLSSVSPSLPLSTNEVQTKGVSIH